MGVARQPRQLTDKQKAFVEEYLRNGGNAAAAYRVVYNSKATPQNSAREAQRLLKHPLIAPCIAEAERRARLTVSEIVFSHTAAKGQDAAALSGEIDRYAISKGRIAAELAKLAFFDARDVFEWTQHGVTLKPSAEITAEASASITAISETQTKHGGTITVKLADKRAALVDLAKLMGYVVERQEIGVRRLDEMSREELEALLADVRSKRSDGSGTRH